MVAVEVQGRLVDEVTDYGPYSGSHKLFCFI